MAFVSGYSESQWQVVEEAQWQAGWDEEVSELDPFVHSRLKLVTGLLPPIWKHVPTADV